MHLLVLEHLFVGSGMYFSWTDESQLIQDGLFDLTTSNFATMSSENSPFKLNHGRTLIHPGK